MLIWSTKGEAMKNVRRSVNQNNSKWSLEITSQLLGRDGHSVSVVSNCTMEMFRGRYHFFHFRNWLLRGFTGNWVKTVPYYNSAQPRPSPTQNLKIVVRIRPVKVYFCSFFNISLSIRCYPERKTMEIMINNVVLLFPGTNEETQYPFPCIATRTFQGPVFRFLRYLSFGFSFRF